MPGVVIFLVGLLYFYYLPVRYDFDGTVFSQTLRSILIKGGLADAIQAHHPLYYPVTFFLYKALQLTTGYNVLEYFHLQLFSLLFGLLTLTFFYKIIKRVTDKIVLHYTAVILMAFCNGFWYYSVEAEVHIAGLFFITAGFYYTFFKHNEILKLRHIIISSFIFSLAAGFHLTNGLILLTVILIFLIEKRGFIKIFQFFSCYLLFFFLQTAIFFIFQKVSPLQLFKTMLFGKDLLTGYEHSYWSGFSPAALWDSLKSAAYGILSPATKITTTLSIVLGMSVLIFILYAGFKKKGEKIYYRFLLWLAPYFIFFTFWDPKKVEFKLNVLLPLIILFIVSSAGFFRGKSRYVIPVIFVIIVSFLNLYFVISPAHDIENNRIYLAAKEVEAVTTPDAIIVIAGFGSDISTHNKIYLPYFAHRRVYILDWVLGRNKSLAAVHSQIKQKVMSGTPVLFFSEVTYLSKTLKRLLKNHSIGTGDYFEFLQKINFKEKIPLRDGYYLKPIDRTF